MADLVSFTGPGGSLTANDFVWVAPETLEIFFPPVATAGDYQMILGPAILDTADNVMDQNRNRIADPLFVDIENGNFELAPGSPATDSADRTQAPATDLLGRPRHNDLDMPNVGHGSLSYADIDAFERQEDTAAADLAVTYVSDPSPEFLASEESFVVEWTVRNVGLEDATGVWQDTVYLSKDPYLSRDDVVLTRTTHNGGLTVGHSYTQSLTATAPAGSAVYYVIVRANAERSFAEPVEANNVMTSSGVLAVNLPMLSIGTPVSGTVRQGKWTYVRLEALEGYTIVLNLDSATSLGRCGRVCPVWRSADTGPM